MKSRSTTSLTSGAAALAASDHVLLAVGSAVGADEIDSTIAGQFADDAEVQVVAPASSLSRLEC